MSEFSDWLKKEKDEIIEGIKKFDVDFEYENILEWCTINKRLHIWWDNVFIDVHENVYTDEKHAHWTFSWNYGCIGFDGIKKEDESKARKATAIFIYLWCKGVDAAVAERCAAGYVLAYNVARI